MNPRVVFRPQADVELLEAKRWYDQRREGLGQEFGLQVDNIVSKILERPLSFPAVHGDTRRAILPRFPYGVFFRVLPDEILVLGVVHARRNPKIWQGRR